MTYILALQENQGVLLRPQIIPLSVTTNHLLMTDTTWHCLRYHWPRSVPFLAAKCITINHLTRNRVTEAVTESEAISPFALYSKNLQATHT